jgi:endonuclease-3
LWLEIFWVLDGEFVGEFGGGENWDGNPIAIGSLRKIWGVEIWGEKILVVNPRGKSLWSILVENHCGQSSWKIIVVNPRGKSLWSILVENHCGQSSCLGVWQYAPTGRIAMRDICICIGQWPLATGHWPQQHEDIPFFFHYFCWMNKAEKVRFLIDTLENLYPETPIPLDHKDPYTLLVAVLLSAQCTDVRVNLVTPELFGLADTPEKMRHIPVEDIKAIIRPCGLSPRKSKAISVLSEMIIEQHGGRVPENFEDLEALPGVGHKTASVVMSQAFGVPAFPVDTHIHRLAYRWGLTNGKNVEQTEKDLKRLFPRELWNKLHLQIIFFGREFCKARGHDPKICPICSVAGRKTLEKS